MNDFTDSITLPDRHIIQKVPENAYARMRARIRSLSLTRRHANDLFLGHTIREHQFVSAEYNRIYQLSNEKWLAKNRSRRLKLHYRNQIITGDGFFLRTVYNQLISHALRKFNVTSVLEVGSGRGNNIIALASENPKVDFAGVEHSSHGVKESRRWIESVSQIPPEILISPSTVEKDKKFDHVRFLEGDARKLSFEDNTFDAAFTVLVLEQIPYEYPEVLEEMKRVSRRFCFFIEPFREANSFFGRSYLRKVDYFRFSYKRFKKFGLLPLAFFTDYPQKEKFQTGFLVVQVKK